MKFKILLFFDWFFDTSQSILVNFYLPSSTWVQNFSNRSALQCCNHRGRYFGKSEKKRWVLKFGLKVEEMCKHLCQSTFVVETALRNCYFCAVTPYHFSVDISSITQFHRKIKTKNEINVNFLKSDGG